MDDELRVLKRRHLVYYLEVYDDVRNVLLGHLVDLTTKGIKLVSKEPVPVDQEYTLRMVLPEGYFAEKVISFAAKSMWSSNDINPDFFDTGFEVEELPIDARKIILSLIHQLGFND